MSITQARRLRRQMTPPELRLWNVLRTRPGGFQFRRQRSSDPFVFDFYCIAAGLAIEVDGLAHELGSNPDRDERRDLMTARRGIKTIRIRALDVRDNLAGVVQMIVALCEERTPPPAPLVPLPGKGRGGK